MRYRNIHTGNFYIVDTSDDGYLDDNREAKGGLLERYQVAKCIYKNSNMDIFLNRRGESECILMEFVPSFTNGHNGLNNYAHYNSHCYYISLRGIIREANEDEIDKFMVWMI